MTKKEYDVGMRDAIRKGFESDPYWFTRYAQCKIYLDGNRWCVLLGSDLQSGIAGFGKTPNEAMADFGQNYLREMVKSIEERNPNFEKISDKVAPKSEMLKRLKVYENDAD